MTTGFEREQLRREGKADACVLLVLGGLSAFRLDELLPVLGLVAGDVEGALARLRGGEGVVTCAQCGARFLRRSSSSKYCSDPCASVGNSRRRGSHLEPRQCELPECAATFVPMKRTQRCCSERHGKKLRNREWRERAATSA